MLKVECSVFLYFNATSLCHRCFKRYIDTMMRLGKIAVVFAGGLALNAGLCAPNPAAAANAPQPASPRHNPLPHDPVPAIAATDSPPPAAASSDNPYAAIAVRNIFGLNPPAPAEAPEDPTKDLPKITPTGIMGVLGNFQVLFKVSPVKPSPADKDQFYILSEGQRQDDIEVVKIDDQKSLVTFDNHGTTQELPLAEASASGGGGPASTPTGGMPGSAPGAPAARGNAAPAGFSSASTPSVGWGPRTPGNNNSNPGNAANDGLNFGANTQDRIYQPEAPNLTPENAQILLAAQHLKAVQENNPTAPLFPPSAIDKEAGIPSNTDDGNGSAGK
jgi:hypothetical protein